MVAIKPAHFSGTLCKSKSLIITMLEGLSIKCSSQSLLQTGRDKRMNCFLIKGKNGLL